MLRKILLAAFVAAAVGAVITCTRVGSYVQTAWNKAKNEAAHQVPPEFEIERLKNEVARLIPDMKKQRSQIAAEMVRIENLREDVNAARMALADQKAAIMAMTSELETGATTVKYGGRDMDASKASEHLERRLAAYQRTEKDLRNKEKLLESHERGLDAAKQQLASIQEQKETLEVEIGHLEAELKSLRLAQTESKFSLDDSKLSRIKADIKDLKDRLKSEQYEVELEGKFPTEPLPEKKSVTDVTREVRQYFQQESKGKVAADE